jgi:penicillin-binding protein 1A
LGAYFSIINNSPDLPEMVVFEGSIAPTFLDRDGNVIERESGVIETDWIPMAQIPRHVQLAFVALEDERFYQHNGVDFRGFVRGMWSGISGGNFQGGSTITQQYIKNSLQVTRNTVETKLQEQYLAIQLEERLMRTFDGDVEAVKNHILEHYMNIIYFGGGQQGLRNAARFYFGKDVFEESGMLELSIAEACVLVAIIQNPAGRNPRRFPERNQARQIAGINRMHHLGFITDEERDEALEEDVYANIIAITQRRTAAGSVDTYFIDQVFHEVARDLAAKNNITLAAANNLIHRGGLVIHTTMNTRIQNIVHEVYRDEMRTYFIDAGYEIEVIGDFSIRNTLTGRETHINRRGSAKSEDEVESVKARLLDEVRLGVDEQLIAYRFTEVLQPQSGFVILDYRTGHVHAIAGGRGEKTGDRTLNRATMTRRQPGSAFKVLASFAPSIDLGHITAATVIDDAPFTYNISPNNDYVPQNWYISQQYPFRGHHNIRTATAHSMNVIAVKNMLNTGLHASFEYLLNFGFSYGPDWNRSNSLWSRDRHFPALALGGMTHGVTQTELAAAFGAIANDGWYVEPIFYTHVYNTNGELLLEKERETRQVLKSTSAYLLTSMMVSSVHESSSTGYRARLARNNQVWMDVAGKTGTSQGGRDNVFVGYTPYFVASIHLGYDQPKDITSNAMSVVHLHIWRTIMERVHVDERGNSWMNPGFDIPPGIVMAEICRVSGLLPRPDGLCRYDPDSRGNNATVNAVITEFFAAGTVPTVYCDFHQSYEACPISNRTATERCPVDRYFRVYRQMPHGSFTFGEGDAYVAIFDRQNWARKPDDCTVCG